MELDPEELRAAARRWDALAGDLVAAARRLRSAPTSDAAVRLLLDTAGEALERLAGDVDRMTDGLLAATREMAAADQRVAAALRGPVVVG